MREPLDLAKWERYPPPFPVSYISAMSERFISMIESITIGRGPKGLAKFKRSDWYVNKLAMTYPYGLDDRNDDDWKIISMLDADREAKRLEWEAAREAHGFNSPAVMSAMDNAMDTVRDGRFEDESEAFYSCALGSLEELLNSR
jgi:hypothetical protein